MTDNSGDVLKARPEGNGRERKAGAGLLPAASQAAGARQVQPWMLKVARLKGGNWDGIGLLYPKNLAGQFMKFMGGKAAMSGVMGAMVMVSGFGMLDMNSRGGFGKVLLEERKPVLFQASSNPDKAQTASAPERQAPSSLSMLSGVNSGLYDAPVQAATEQRGAAKNPAQADGQGAADEQAAGMDPGQMLAAQQQTAARMASAPIGKFSKGTPPLNGGMGFSSGIGQGFKQLGANNSAMGKAKAFNKSAKARVTRAAMPSSGSGPMSMRGKSARRLERMNRVMRPTRAGDAEEGSAIHTQE
ncbi:MAG: hypothetical protein WCI75_18225, partial [candidate division NC10 bacterium]